MNTLEEIMREIEAKREEVAKAHEELVRFKADLDEGFRKLRYMRLRVLRLAESGEVTPAVKKMIEDATHD